MRSAVPTGAIVIAGGGTGGHVFPGLALAAELARRMPARPIAWIGARGGIEARLVPAAGIALMLLPLAGMARRGLLQRAAAVVLAATATLRLLAGFTLRRPLLVAGVGGFASGPAVLAAAFLGVPTLVLEQNAVAGGTNRVLARFAGATAASFEQSLPQLGPRAGLTGNPVRDEIAAIGARPARPVARVLAFGGSRGARALNAAWIGALPLFAGSGLSFTLQTGDDDAPALREAARAAGLDAEVLTFIDDMPLRLDAADLVVARAGATTVAELTAAGRAALLVPFPHAAGDHQRANARALESAGAAIVIDQSDLTPQRLADEVLALARDPQRVAVMSAAARALGRRDAAARVADLAGGLLA